MSKYREQLFAQIIEKAKQDVKLEQLIVTAQALLGTAKNLLDFLDRTGQTETGYTAELRKAIAQFEGSEVQP